MTVITYADLSEEYDDSLKPPLDRYGVDESRLTPEQRAWRSDGVLVRLGLLPDALIERYCELRRRVTAPGGWHDPCPYLRHDALKDIALYAPLVEQMEALIGQAMGLHLTLTGWVSTERRFHSDDYLNPEFVHAHYVAAWMALDDVHPDAGPFQFVRGSHRWPPLRRHKLFAHIPTGEAARAEWPSTTQDLVGDAIEREIERRGATVESFLGRRGDVLFWHGRLLHQGSRPAVPGKPRLALIAHYSSLAHRRDMHDRKVYAPTGKTYFDFSNWRDPRHDRGLMLDAT